MCLEIFYFVSFYPIKHNFQPDSQGLYEELAALLQRAVWRGDLDLELVLLQVRQGIFTQLSIYRQIRFRFEIAESTSK